MTREYKDTPKLKNVREVRTGGLHPLGELVNIGPLLLHGAKVELRDHLGNGKGAEPHAPGHRFAWLLLFFLLDNLRLGGGPGLFYD